MSFHDVEIWLVDAVWKFARYIGGLIFVMLIGRIRQKLRARTGQAFQVRGAINQGHGEKMEKVILDGKELDVKIEFKEGKLALIVQDEGKQGGGQIELHLSTDALLDKLAAAIPGTLDDAVIAIVKEALKKV